LCYRTRSLTFILSAHAGRGRKVKAHQKVHSSIAFCKPDPEKSDERYCPKAISDELKVDLSTLVGVGERDNMEWAIISESILELDIFDLTTAKDVVTSLAPPNDLSDKTWEIPKYSVARLETLTWSGEFNQIVAILKTKDSWTNSSHAIDEGCAALLKVETAIHSITWCLKFGDSEVKSRVLEVLRQLQKHSGEPFTKWHIIVIDIVRRQHSWRPRMLFIHSLLSLVLKIRLLIF